MNPARKQKNFVQIPIKVLSNPNLSTQSKVIYSILRSHAWYKNNCFPSQESLAQKTGLKKWSVWKYLKELKAFGLIDWKQKGFNQSNEYTLLPIPAMFDLYDNEVTCDISQPTVCDISQPNNIEPDFERYEKKDNDNGLTFGSTGVYSSSKGREIREPLSTVTEILIKSYFVRYFQKTGRKHPRLRADQMHRIENILEPFVTEHIKGYEDESAEVKKLLDRWFSSRIETDWNINHFATDGILENKWYELFY
jgi:biotin operon repressor